MALLPPVIVTLLADTKDFSAGMDKSIAKVDEFGAAADKNSSKFSSFASKASTAVIGLGVAFGAYALDKAYKFQEAMDQIRNQTNLTSAQVTTLSNTILNLSSATGVATGDLASAALAAAQAGQKGAALAATLKAAAEAQIITGQNVVDITHTLIAAQALQIAKGVDVATLTGILVAGAKETTGGFAAEAAMLQGRVGVALAQYGLKLKDVIALGAELTKTGLPTRSINSFVTGLGKINAPLETIHTTSKKSYETLSTWAIAVNAAGLSAAKLQAMLREGNISGILLQIRDAAGSSVPKLQQLNQLVFGSGGAGAAGVLEKNLGQYQTVIKTIAGSGAGSLQTGFAGAMKQLGPQLHQLEAEFNVFAIRFGRALLPAATDVLRWVNDFLGILKRSPLLRDIFGGTAAALFATAIAYKLTSIFRSIWGTFNQAAQTSLLTDIATNTAVIAGEGGVGGIAKAAAGATALRGAGILASGAVPGAVLGGVFIAGFAGAALAQWTSAMGGAILKADVGRTAVTRGAGAHGLGSPAAAHRTTVTFNVTATKH